ncbi:MAG: S8 family serine peptidase [bacterium]
MRIASTVLLLLTFAGVSFGQVSAPRRDLGPGAYNSDGTPLAKAIEGEEWVPGHLIVNLKASAGAAIPVTLDDGIVSMGIPSLDGLLAAYRIYEAKRLVPDEILSRLEFSPDFGRLYLLSFPITTDVLSMRADFEANPYVQYAEPDLLRRILRNPNDPLWSNQWDKIRMACDVAWDYTTGDSTIIVCAIDTGTDWNHPDLTPNLWVNPGEDLDGDGVPWDYEDLCGDQDDIDRVDNDGNGYVDDLIGWDFIDNISGCAAWEDCDEEDMNPFGLEPHGTHCLGLMAARGDNATGVTGAGWTLTGMAIRAGYLASDGWAYMPLSATLPAIYYAAAMGAKVIVMPYGGPAESSSEREAVQWAWNHGCLLFGAAGNEASEQMLYPACHPHVMSVASTDNGDHLSSWSNRGTWLDICAPGGPPGCWSTIIDGYGGSAWQGTSMACANAGGTAALVWGVMPELTNDEMDSLIMSTCDDITAQNPGIDPEKLGAGRISASNMLATRFPRLSVQEVVVSGDNDGDGRLERNETANLILTLRNEEGWTAAIDIRGRASTDDPHLTVTQDSVYFGDLLPGEETDNSAFPIEISADSMIEQAYWADFTLDLTTATGYEATLDFQLRIEWSLLLVDDDAGNIYDTKYAADFDCLGVVFEKWDVEAQGSPDAGMLSGCGEVFWICGNEESATLTDEDQANLAAFLDAGGKLALIGRLIDRDLYDEPFYADYLHCATEGLDSAGIYQQLSGVPGDEISDGTSLLLAGTCSDNGNTVQSCILPMGGASAVYTYDGGHGIAAIKYGDSTTYQIVYCAFALEAACGSNMTDHHRVVVGRIVQWFRNPPPPPRIVGYVTLISPPGPPNWGYRLHWVSGAVSRLVFTDFCSGTIGAVGGNAESMGWTMSNYADSIFFAAGAPLTSGYLDTFWLSHPYCSDVVTWTAGDSSGTIEGPLPVELTTFEALGGDGQVTLHWRTESELDNDHFVLHKRKAGEENFHTLAQVSGHGTTTEPHDYEFVDRWVQNGVTYEYRISDVDMTGRETVHEQIASATPFHSAVPLEFALHPNWPNPFNPKTTIRYDVKETGLVTLKVFDLLGREVATLVKDEIPAGSQVVIWDAMELPSGIYLCRMEAQGFAQTRKLLLVK